jgi:hypothetical protein
MDIDSDVAKGMYEAIDRFGEDGSTKYGLHVNKLYFERIALADYDVTYCKMEWFTPVYEKVD